MPEEQLVQFLAKEDGATSEDDPNYLSAEDYTEAANQFGKKIREAVAIRTLKNLENYLLIVGDPKDFRGFLTLAELNSQTLLAFLLKQGFIQLTYKSRVSKEEQAERDKLKAEREAKKVDPEQPTAVIASGQYL